jgi:hypothetical protein
MVESLNPRISPEGSQSTVRLREVAVRLALAALILGGLVYLVVGGLADRDEDALPRAPADLSLAPDAGGAERSSAAVADDPAPSAAAADGTTTPAEAASAPVEPQDGRPVSIAGVITSAGEARR